MVDLVWWRRKMMRSKYGASQSWSGDSETSVGVLADFTNNCKVGRERTVWA